MTSKKMPTSFAERNGFHQWAIPILVLAIFGAWTISYFLIRYSSPSLEAAGQFGDMFGAINSLFSGMALAGIVVAIFLQRNELQLQREELKMTRTELSRAAAAQEKSEKALVEQARALERSSELTALQFLPFFEIDVRYEITKATSITITNVADLPAYDIDVRILSVYSDDVCPLQKFISQYVTRSDERLGHLELSAAREFSISDSTFEFSLPSGTMISGTLLVPGTVQRILVLFQYRNAFGNNYSHLYTFYLSFRPNGPRYQLMNLEPIAPKIGARIHEEFDPNYEYDGSEDESPQFQEKLATEDGSPTPEEFEDFMYLWAISMPISFLETDLVTDETERFSIQKVDGAFKFIP